MCFFPRLKITPSKYNWTQGLRVSTWLLVRGKEEPWSRWAQMDVEQEQEARERTREPGTRSNAPLMPRTFLGVEKPCYFHFLVREIEKQHNDELKGIFHFFLGFFDQCNRAQKMHQGVAEF